MLAHTMGPSPVDDAAPPPRRWALALRRTAFAGAVVLNLVVLLAPDPDAPGSGVPGLDKVVHAGVFALLTAAGLAVGLAARWFVPAVLAWAALSEVIQATLLPARSGDWRDLVADAVGVAVGVAAVRAVAARRARRPA